MLLGDEANKFPGEHGVITTFYFDFDNFLFAFFSCQLCGGYYSFTGDDGFEKAVR